MNSFKLLTVGAIFNSNGFPVQHSFKTYNDAGDARFKITCYINALFMSKLDDLEEELDKIGVVVTNKWFDADRGKVVCHFTTTVP